MMITHQSDRTSRGETHSLIHLYSYRFWTGGAEPALRLARSQTVFGDRVRVGVDTKRCGNIGRRARRLGLELIDNLVCSSHSNPVEFIRDGACLRRLAVAENIQLIHAHLSHDHVLAWLATRGLATCRVVRTIHSSRSLRRRLLQRALLMRSDGLIVVCRDHRSRLQALLGKDRPMIATVFGAIDHLRFAPDTETANFRQRFGIPQSAVLVGSIARFSSDRRQRQLVEAFSDVQRHDSTAYLMLAGRGEQLEAVQALARKELDCRRVIFPGYLKDKLLEQAYAACDIGVWLEEGNDASCRGMLKAMASGSPMVVGDHGAMLEAAGDGTTGICVDASDPPSIAQSVLDLVRDPERRAKLGLAARQRVLQRHTEEKQRGAVASFYQHVLRR